VCDSPHRKDVLTDDAGVRHTVQHERALGSALANASILATPLDPAVYLPILDREVLEGGRRDHDARRRRRRSEVD
jgi:hypothetical protein